MSKHAPAASRRWHAALILALFALAVVGAAALGWRYARESPPHQGPILFISASGLSADRLRTYGATSDDDTPAIDALAQDGVVFERTYTHSPQTLPAHASLFTGQLPFEHHVRGDAGFTLPASARTLAELLRNRGFETGAAVSSFLLRPEAGTGQGFSFFDGLAPQSPGDEAVVERDGLSTLEAAEGWMNAREGQRFFLFVQVDQRDAEMAVERLTQQLKERRAYEQATIVLVGDHGNTESVASFDGAWTHVPLVVKQPNGAGSGGRVSLPVQHIDLLPTILDFVRAPIPSDLRGRSLRGVLEGNESGGADRAIYSESLDAHFRFGGQPVFGLSTGNYRYVRGHGEAIVAVEGTVHGTPTPDLESPEGSNLRTELERLLRDRAIDMPVPVTAAEAERFAALGHLPGARLAIDQTAALNERQEAELIKEHQSAARLVGMRRYSAAAESLRRVARAYPTLAVFHYQLGSLLLETGRLEEAVASFRTAADLAPHSPVVPATLAGALLRWQELDLAWTEAQRAVALADGYDAKTVARVHEVAVAVALARKEPELATHHAEQAQKADPTFPVALFVRGRLLYDEGQYAEALPVLQEAEAVLEEHQGALQNLHYYLADTLAQLDRYDEAEVELREEQRAFPSAIRSYSSLAMLYRATGRDADLEGVIRDLMEAVPTPEGYATAAQLWTILGEQSRAEAVRSDARSRFRGDPSLALLERRADRR
jgi:tetratricopeptide (TPR) repeat protein